MKYYKLYCIINFFNIFDPTKDSSSLTSASISMASIPLLLHLTLTLFFHHNHGFAITLSNCIPFSAPYSTGKCPTQDKFSIGKYDQNRHTCMNPHICTYTHTHTSKTIYHIKFRVNNIKWNSIHDRNFSTSVWKSSGSNPY